MPEYAGLRVFSLDTGEHSVYLCAADESWKSSIYKDGTVLYGDAEAGLIVSAPDGVWVLYQGGEQCMLNKLSTSSELLLDKELTEPFADDIACSAGGDVFVKAGSIYAYDSSGNETGRFEVDARISSLVRGTDGEVYLCRYTPEGILISLPGGETQLTVDNSAKPTIFDGQGEYDFFAVTGKGVFGIENALKWSEVQPLLFWSESMIAYFEGTVPCAAVDGSFIYYEGDAVYRLSPSEEASSSRVKLVLATCGVTNLG